MPNIDTLLKQAVKLGDVKITKYLEDRAYTCIIVDPNGNHEIGVNNSAIKAIEEAIKLTKAKELNNDR